MAQSTGKGKNALIGFAAIVGVIWLMSGTGSDSNPTTEAEREARDMQTARALLLRKYERDKISRPIEALAILTKCNDRHTPNALAAQMCYNDLTSGW